MKRLVGLLGALLFSALAAWAPAQAQSYPSRPIRLVVPWPPGTPGDVVGRVLGEHMGKQLGQAVVVDNKPGAFGTVGLSDAQRQPADGYTLYMLAAPATLLAPVLLPAQKSDVGTLEPVGLAAWSYNVLATAVASPLRSPEDIVAAAKARPGALSFPSGGNGTPAHIAGEMFKLERGLQIVHVPYNQFPLAINDLISGRIDFMFLTSAAAIPQMAGGKLRGMATTGAKRLSALPDVPTMTELGFHDFVVRGFEMITAPAGTPREVIDKLNAALNAAVRSPEVKERLDKLGLETEAMTPAQARATLVAEQAALLKVARTIGLKAD